MRADRLERIVLFDGDRVLLWEEIARQLASLRGGRDVLIAGPEPTASPSLLRVLKALGQAGRRPILLTDARALSSAERIHRLVAAGLHEVSVLWQPGTSAVLLDRLAEHPVRLSLAVELTPELEAIEQVARSRGLPVRVLRSMQTVSRPPPRLDDARAAALVDLWQRARVLGVRLIPDDLGRTPSLSKAKKPIALRATDLELLSRGVHPEPLQAGVLLTSSPEAEELRAEALTLAAWGLRPRDVPVCLGGVAHTPGARRVPACAHCAAKCDGPSAAVPRDAVAPLPMWTPLPAAPKVHVVLPWTPDHIFAVSTMPALVESLRARGAQVQFHHAWDLRWDPKRLDPPRDIPTWKRLGWLAWRTLTKRPTPVDHYTAPPGRHGHPNWSIQDRARSQQIDRELFASLDLSDADAVVVPGYSAAHLLLATGSIPPTARVVIADFHMLEDVQHLSGPRLSSGRRAADGGWWPSPSVQVHSCFPRYARLYRAQGVPLRRVHWRSYPLFLGHFSSSSSPHEAATIFSGGRNFRDYGTLAEAAALLEGVRPIHLYAADPPAAVGPLLPQGTVPLADFVAAIQASRFVVLPLLHDVDTAAGLTILAMAHAAGRPVIASLTGGTRDHIRHEVDGLLVPPHDPVSLAEAIRSLDTDEDLLRRLSDGARQAGTALSVDRWAREILDGTLID